MKPVRTIELTHAELVDGRGRRSIHTLLLIRARDVLLVEAAMFFPGASDREVARRLLAALKTYRAGRWRRDAALALCPPQHAGSYRALFWLILKLHDHVPCDRAVRAALARASITQG
jgi:hypothetical protein